MIVSWFRRQLRLAPKGAGKRKKGNSLPNCMEMGVGGTPLAVPQIEVLPPTPGKGVRAPAPRRRNAGQRANHREW